VRGERPDDDQRQRRHCRATDQTEAFPTPHDVTERITKESRAQAKKNGLVDI
jgi:hypothetical protein